MIKKFGIPNIVYKHCTRELKVQAMNSYLKSLGIKPKSVPTAIGIRADEAKRMSKTAHLDNLVYPLVNINPKDKAFVKHYWDETMPFTLGLEEHDGNCIGCFEKSFDKIAKQLASNPRSLDFHIRMEKLYGHVGNREGKPNRVFFRRNTPAIEVSKLELKDVLAREKEREEKRMERERLMREKALRKIEREEKRMERERLMSEKALRKINPNAIKVVENKLAFSG